MSDDLPSKASELLKKVLTAGVGAAFLTEESLRSLMNEIKLPKEILLGILEVANKTRKEFLQGLSDDLISRVMEKVNWTDFAREFLHENEIELKVNLKFKQKK